MRRKRRTPKISSLGGMKVREFNKIYKEYSNKFDLFEKSGYTRSDKISKKQFRKLLESNYQEDKEAFNAKKIVERKFKDQTTFIANKRKNEAGDVEEYRISGKTAKKWYEAYVREYLKKMEKLGDKMFDKNMLSFEDYLNSREGYKKSGITQNVNRAIVNDQAYQFSMSNAMNVRDLAEEYGIEELANANLRDIMEGNIQIDAEEIDKSFLSRLNEEMKNAHPDWDGNYRAQVIAHGVYGSE